MTGDDERTPADDATDRTTPGGREPSDDHGRHRAGRRPPVADGGFPPREFLRALGDERCRHLLEYLRANGSAGLEEAAEHVASRETWPPGRAADDRTKRRIQAEIYHLHAPKLEASGVVAYDRPEQEVRLRRLPKPVEEFLDGCGSGSDGRESP